MDKEPILKSKVVEAITSHTHKGRSVGIMYYGNRYSTLQIQISDSVSGTSLSTYLDLERAKEILQELHNYINEYEQN